MYYKKLRIIENQLTESLTSGIVYIEWYSGNFRSPESFFIMRGNYHERI